MRVAFLINQYPTPTHTFVRRQIQALERLGLGIDRCSLRRAPGGLVDPTDAQEALQTHVVLHRPGQVIIDLLIVAVTRPFRFLGALRATLRWGAPSRIRALAYLAEAAALLRRWDRGPVDHVHVHFGTNATNVAALAQRLGGPTFSVTVHGDEPFTEPWRHGLEERLAEATSVIAVCTAGVDRLRRILPGGDVHLIRCGLETDELRTIPGPPPPDGGLVFVGSLIERKRPDRILDAALSLWADGRQFDLVFIGDGPLRESLEARAAESGVQNRIRFVGWAGGDEIRRVLAASRAMVLPSQSEGLPIVLLEAFAAGRPVVTTDVGGIVDLVDESCGWIVPVDDVPALSTALKAALDSTPDQLHRQGLEGRRRVLDSHTISSEVAALSHVLGVSSDPARLGAAATV